MSDVVFLHHVHLAGKYHGFHAVPYLASAAAAPSPEIRELPLANPPSVANADVNRASGQFARVANLHLVLMHTSYVFATPFAPSLTM